MIEHQKYCKQHSPKRVSYPTKGEDDILQFKNIHKQLEAPFIIYADFESILVPTSERSVILGIADIPSPPPSLSESEKREWEKNAKNVRKEFKYQEHKAVSYCYKVVSILDGAEYDIPIYVGEDAAEHQNI